MTVNNDTKYTRRSEATSEAIKAGKCLTARGAKDAAGAPQATTIELRKPVNVTCGEPGQPGQGG